MFYPLRTVVKPAVSIALLAILPVLSYPSVVRATDFDKPVFQYQSKLASKGNAQAQYYLAQMYEEGRGTKADPEMARHWYELARQNGYSPTETKTAAN